MASTDNYTVTEGTHNYCISTHMDTNDITSLKLYTQTYSATSQQVRDAFNAGQLWGVYSGHGGTYSWADGPPFYESDVNNLTNEGMYPLVLSFACVTGTYTVDDCFTEIWMLEEGRRCSGRVGARRSTAIGSRMMSSSDACSTCSTMTMYARSDRPSP